MQLQARAEAATEPGEAVPGQLVYIASPSYSGSTLLTFLLASHPDVATIGELKATQLNGSDYVCSCRKPMRDCPFWSRVRQELAATGVDFDVSDFGTHIAFRTGVAVLDRILNSRPRGAVFEVLRRLARNRAPGASGDLSRLLERNRDLIRAICRVQGARTFLDASKDPTRLLYLLEGGLWDTRVIHLTRDGRGAASSYMRVYRAPMKVAALEWRRTNEACERLMSRLPQSQWMRLRYEDVCRAPEQALNRIHEWLGTGPAPVPADFRSIEHHVLGNAMRLRSTGSIENKESWRDAMTAEEQACFQRIAGQMNRAYGYE